MPANRKSYALGKTRRIAFKHQPNSPSRASKLSSRKRLGSFHKRNHQTAFKTRRTNGFHFVGLKRASFCTRNRQPPPCFKSSAPKPSFGLSWLFRLQALLKNKRLSYSSQQGSNKLELKVHKRANQSNCKQNKSQILTS